MNEFETLSALISDIYDAALDARLWDGALGRVREFVGGYSATLFVKDTTSTWGHVLYGEGKIGPHYTRLYFEKYAKIDPGIGRFFADVGVTVATQDLISYEDVWNTRFYKEWMRPQGLLDLASTILDRSKTTVAVFGIFRRERDGVVDDEMRARMRLVVPHLRRAVLVGGKLDHATITAAGFADTLDGLNAAIFLVDDMRAIVHANASGDALVASGNVLRGFGGRLTASDPKSDQELREVLAAASIGDAAVGVAGIAQPLVARDGERYVAHVMPLTSGARRQAGKHYAAVAVLFVHKVAAEFSSASEAVAKVHTLTPSELRALLAIVNVGGVPEAAEALGVSEHTVRTHLHRVFAKTGASSQVDLVKLVAEFSSPLLG